MEEGLKLLLNRSGVRSKGCRANGYRWLRLAIAMGLGVSGAARLGADRVTQSLDGQWQIADSRSADDVPRQFDRTVSVPGLVNLAQPAFPQVDAFFSREQLATRIRANLAPVEWLSQYWKGKPDQDRDYFWYRKTFRAPSARAVALLKVGKAQFGTAVWLNGRKLGEYAGCFSAGYFPMDYAIRWGEENTLVVRIGAHPAVLPENYPTGSDFEKIKWTPGIYDSVSLIFCDNPVIETLQVAPRIATSEIVVQTRVKNHGGAPATAALAHTVRTWKGGRKVAVAPPEPLTLDPGEERVVTRTIKIPAARLWSPEDPFLYVVESDTGGDSLQTRFGMREFRFDAATKRAYLNGKVYYLRGSNITLHRFFEDPLCRDLPWNEAWVRKLLGDLPKKMHWNSFRFCIGPVPDRWFDICDEVGLLIQNEFPIWTGRPHPVWFSPQVMPPGYSRSYDADELIRQFRDWMRDHWNHPSVAIWDTKNETEEPLFGSKIVPAVRALDLSDRPWENSYDPPVGPDDPLEYHAYRYVMMEDSTYKLTPKVWSDLETSDGSETRVKLPSYRHPVIVNEYGWLWLSRDGSPTPITEKVYGQLMGPDATARQRLDLCAYLLAVETEYMRSHRRYAGIMHFVYLTCSYPGVYTSDHFSDVTRLKLDPAFVDYMGEAFKPLGVYLNFQQPTLKAGASREFTVKLVNDESRPLSGTLVLLLETEGGRELARTEQRFEIGELGAATHHLRLTAPANASGKCVLKATARPADGSKLTPTVSRRWVTLEKQP